MYNSRVILRKYYHPPIWIAEEYPNLGPAGQDIIRPSRQEHQREESAQTLVGPPEEQ